MSQVFMNCPNTGKPVYIGLNMEWGQLEALDPRTIDRRVPSCPQCGLEHRFEKRDLFLRADGSG